MPQRFELAAVRRSSPAEACSREDSRVSVRSSRLTAGELGMGPDQLELALARRLAHRRLERGLKLGDSAKRPPAPRRLRDPGRVLEQPAEVGQGQTTALWIRGRRCAPDGPESA